MTGGSKVLASARRVFAELRPGLRPLHRCNLALSPRTPSSRTALSKLLMRGALPGVPLGVHPLLCSPWQAAAGTDLAARVSPGARTLAPVVLLYKESRPGAKAVAFFWDSHQQDALGESRGPGKSWC